MRNIEKDEIEMAAKRELMLKKGFEIFSKKGIESVAMQEIANACSVGIATLYRVITTLSWRLSSILRQDSGRIT